MADLAGVRIGFIGLGNMGSPIAARLVKAGADVIGFDPSAEARDRLRAIGGRVVDSAAGVADAELVILMLPGSAVVESVLLGDGVADLLTAGTLVIDMSSSEPLRTRELAVELEKRNLRFVDAPVSGGVKGAVKGTLTIMVGGSDADVAAADGVLTVLGKPKRVGPIAAGHALKALNNLLSATHLWATSEAILAGEKFGLDPTTMLDAMNSSSGRSGSTENKWPNFILPGTYNSGFSLQLMLKDMRIATDLARSLDMPITLGDAAVAEWERAADALDPTADHTEVARYLESQVTTHSDGPAALATPRLLRTTP
jgi:3-hydroxyisobutyrate dehydrogenase